MQILVMWIVGVIEKWNTIKRVESDLIDTITESLDSWLSHKVKRKIELFLLNETNHLPIN